jgi:hypothetical protein
MQLGQICILVIINQLTVRMAVHREKALFAHRLLHKI